jgi:hypothetical protein
MMRHMSIDLNAAADFMATHARVLDRRRFELRTGGTDPAGALAALDGYRNPDGGYGWGLEPDLRSPESQPGAAAHAFEVFEDVAPATSPHAVSLCDWLDTVTLDDGGLPFVLALTTPAGSAPWWQTGDPGTSSLQITAFTTAAAHRVGAHDPAVAAHPWLARATAYCLEAIAAMDEPPFAYVLEFCIQLLDAVHETALLAQLGAFIPADGRLPVRGGTEGEALNPLDITPYPDRPSRELIAPDVIAADLERLAGEQRDDGGWDVDYLQISPAGKLDWRGVATVRAIDILRRNGMIS